MDLDEARNISVGSQWALTQQIWRKLPRGFTYRCQNMFCFS